MFRSKTVFVLGAGASFEAGMPTGLQLAERISRLLNFRWDSLGHLQGDARTLAFFQTHGAELSVAKQISNGIRFSNSIDEYIDRRKNPHIERIGKLAIAYEILRAELSSRVSVDASNIFNGLETQKVAGTWYLHLARMLFRPTDTRAIDRLFANLSFIDFNYDRCLDQFFRYAIRDAYSVDAAHSDALLETMPRLRPYGSIGPLQLAGIPNGVPFGCDPNRTDINGIVDRIKTYTEQVATEAADKIKAEFASAQTVVFLGFGFHEQNMRLLAPNGKTPISKVIATAKGMSEDDRRIIRDGIAELCHNHIDVREDIIVRDLTCAELFKEYRLTLQAA